MALAGLGLVLVIAAGIALRFSFPADIEWKGDEKWTFDRAQSMAAGGPWPAVGMASSIGLPNPGLSLWVFAGLSAVSDVKTPPELARAVQSLNAVALVAFAIFAFAAIPKERREPWLWAVVLWAVNPLAVVYERKIWPPSVLPIFTVAFIAAWYYRRAAAAAFAWGLLGALMAQLHMGAAFLAIALAAWTLVHDRGAFPWKSWLAGSIVGVLPALPWLFDLLSRGSGASHGPWRLPILQYYLLWFSQPFGFGIEHLLGPLHIFDYLRGPLLAGHATFVMAAVHAVLVGVLLLVLARTIRVAAADGWPGSRALFFGTSAETLLITSVFWGYGGCLAFVTMFGASFHRHYLIVIAPILALWAALAVLYGDRASGVRPRARAVLLVICVGQAVLSAGLLSYIHSTAVIRGEYGATWRSQQPGFVATEP